VSRTLSADSTLETLKKEAKRWLKAIRAGDARAKERFLAATGTAPDTAGLRDVQLALAREYGFPGWIALRGALDDLALARRSRAERVEIILRSVTWHGDQAAAARILTRWPELGTYDFYIAVATGNVAEVKQHLERDPDAARRKGGPLVREPLLYLTYSRLPGSETNALAIATTLLDHGADPNVGFTDDWQTPFEVLTGVIGEGEGDHVPHPQAKQLAALLIERGADSFDSQSLYNTSITRDDTTWLDILWTECARRGSSERWRMVTPALGDFASVNALDYLLGNAVAHDHMRRAEWLLEHGATLVNARQARSGVTPLFCLPNDEDDAADVAAFLLASGADPRVANNDGATAEQVARQRGLIDAADLMV
jgi:hypothetical protein